jgi:hypothetical protein
MWTFDNFPAATVKLNYGADITQAWLDHLRLSTLRLSNCTAAFVSPHGLILTNHHCVEPCLADLSTPDKSFDERGFGAVDRAGEQRCLTQIADVLVGMEDVTDQVAAAIAGLDDNDANEARKKRLTALEQSCDLANAKAKGGPLDCQSVTLYDGGRYFLYKYKRYHDLRMVFAPEADIAAFGGDPDNFQFPRWSLDFSLLRAYENGKPAKTPDYLPIDFEGPTENELVFVAGHPGSTSRLMTRAELEFDRDLRIPSWLLRNSELRGRYIQFGKSSPTDGRMLLAPLNSLENAIKVRRKLLDALHDDTLMERKTAAETELRAAAHLEGDPWHDIELASRRERAIYLPYNFLEAGAGFNSSLFRYARALVRGADERLKPNAERLREYTDAALPRIQQLLFAPIPAYPEFESMTLSFSLERMREWLGPDHPVVRRLLAMDSPDSLATRLVTDTKLNDAAVRKALWEGGRAAINASDDPMIELARDIDPEARAIRRLFETQVEAQIDAASERIAAARFKVYGTQVYPDATFTLRLSYGTVQGWVEDGMRLKPFTNLGRAFERATGSTPFKIPDSWMRVRDQLDMATPFNIATSNDIVGGNSGSPLIDARGRLVGLMFDGNIHSISGDYWFDAERNRAIAVHPAIIKEALDKVYGATALLSELGAK